MLALTRHRYGGPEQLRLENIDEPRPARNQVLVRVLACGMNLSDWEALTGRPAYARIEGLFKPRRPILGSDLVGEIVSLGSNVSEWTIGQKVWADLVMHGKGCLAEMAVAPADRIAALPDGMDPHLAAALPQSGAIALAAVKELKNGQRLLVIGAGGGTGALLLPMAREIAGHITAVDSAEKSSVMMQLGADVTIDYRQTDFTKTGENWDCIIDLAATRTAWQVRKSLSEHGRYIVFGGAMKSLLTALATPKCSVGQADGSPRVLQQLSDLFSDGRLMPEIVSKLSLEDAASGLQDVGEGKVAGKIVVIPGTTKVGES